LNHEIDQVIYHSADDGNFSAGRGLGSSLVMIITKAHGGQLNLETTEGQSAAFEIDYLLGMKKIR
jgi:K+-sensing histidine kinase KdpD